MLYTERHRVHNLQLSFVKQQLNLKVTLLNLRTIGGDDVELGISNG